MMRMRILLFDVKITACLCTSASRLVRLYVVYQSIGKVSSVSLYHVPPCVLLSFVPFHTSFQTFLDVEVKDVSAI